MNPSRSSDLQEFLSAASRMLDTVDEIYEYIFAYAFGHKLQVELHDQHFAPKKVNLFQASVDRFGEEWASDDGYGCLDHEIVDEVARARKRFNKPFRPYMEFFSDFTTFHRPYRSASEFLIIVLNELRRALYDVDYHSKRKSLTKIAASGIENCSEEERLQVCIDLGIVLGRLTFLPWIDSGSTLLEIDREIDAAARMRTKGLSWYVRGEQAGNGAPEEQLTPNAEIVFRFLTANHPSPKMAKEIAAATDIPISTITRHIVPQLKQVCGLRNIAGKGYVLPRVK